MLGAARPLLAAAQLAQEVRSDLTLEQITDMVVAIAKIPGDLELSRADSPGCARGPSPCGSGRAHAEQHEGDRPSRLVPRNGQASLLSHGPDGNPPQAGVSREDMGQSGHLDAVDVS